MRSKGQISLNSNYHVNFNYIVNKLNRIFILLPGSCPRGGTWGCWGGGSKTLAWGFAMAPHRLRVVIIIIIHIFHICISPFFSLSCLQCITCILRIQKEPNCRFRDQARGRLGRNGRPGGRNLALNGTQGEVGVSLKKKKIFFFFFFLGRLIFILSPHKCKLW